MHQGKCVSLLNSIKTTIADIVNIIASVLHFNVKQKKNKCLRKDE
jgi:hypothetical protein